MKGGGEMGVADKRKDTLTVKEWKEGEAPNVVLSEAVPMRPRESDGADSFRSWRTSPT
jgi:hypothetical protein